MKNSEKKPVWKLKESIWRLFQISGKKHLFITGSRQTGKTTVLNAILGQDIDYCGIKTHAVRNGQCTPEYVLLESIHDPSIKAVIGRRNEQSDRLCPCLTGFETGVQILTHCLEGKKAWIVIDEIGFLESDALAFQNIIRVCLHENRVLAVLRKGSTLFLEELYARQDALVIDLDNLPGL